MLNRILKRLFIIKSKIIFNPFISNKKYQSFFKKFNYQLEEKTNTKLERYYKLRFHEINSVICKYKIKNVLELGTGRTTFIFNIIPSVKCVSVEQDQKWLKTIDNLLNQFGITANINLSSVSEYKNGAKFDELPIIEPDLLYIDAPYFKKKGNSKWGGFNTYTGKAAYYDFESFFEKNIFPKIIMIEGRTDTADAILSTDFSKKYDFIGEFIYCIQRKKYLPSLNFSRHSIFILKR
tara:strand:- start:189 stop:896 length:708 start_codon:yes stop_codon:yes gene_type:complete